MECTSKEAAKKKEKAVKSKSKRYDEHGVVVGKSGSVRKIRSFKRIRGFLPEESRRERRARKDRDRAQASASASRDVALSRLSCEDSSNQGDDDSINDGDGEDRSVPSRELDASPPKAKAQPNMLGLSKNEEAAMEDHEAFFSSGQFETPYLRKLEVVLLLMDPHTCRFELLQLEFNSLNALVSDVLAHIPVSCTDTTLRKKAYSGVCGRAGQELTSDKLLATFCHGNDVLVAIPTGLSAKECARLAKPILGDVKVGVKVRHRINIYSIKAVDFLLLLEVSMCTYIGISHDVTSCCTLCIHNNKIMDASAAF
jgi:hypothetical protein